MRHSVLVTLALVCSVPALVHGQDFIFGDDFEFGLPNGWSGIQGWAPAAVAKTGQVRCFAAAGYQIPCENTGQDGDLRPGVAWPVPRFVDNGDGTVTDNLTNLVWLRVANCFGYETWDQALTDANTLSPGVCGLMDGSVAGDWRLPSINELLSLVDYEYLSPALSNAAGTEPWAEGDPFTGVRSDRYWSSTTDAGTPWHAWGGNIQCGMVESLDKMEAWPVWPVRGGTVY